MIKDVARTLAKGMGSLWRDVAIYREKSVSLRTKCERVVSLRTGHGVRKGSRKSKGGKRRL